jgi:2-(1,2-epoxy-1,2-dihydrophenyl)acetyl-CoA isomerase
MNRDLIMGLLKTMNEVNDDPKVRVVVITGNGRGFCAGADLANGGWPNEKNNSPGQAAANNMEIGFNPLVRAITSADKPVITAINGIAAGGGVGLALSGDIVVAAESAKFKLVFGPQLGIISDVGSSWFVPHLIGRARANGMGLLGEDIGAKEAKEWGLIWDYYPNDEFMDSVSDLAERLANGPIEGLKAVVKAHDHALSTSLDKQLDYERDTQKIFLDRKEFREGVKAFIEKRKPDFKSIKN